MLQWLWGGGGAGPAAPPISPALREAMDSLSTEIVSRLRKRGPFPDDRALAAACGFDADRARALARHLGATVRSYGEQERNEKTIAPDSVVVAFHEASVRRADFAGAVLCPAQTSDSDKPAVVPLTEVEAVLRDCLGLVDAPASSDEGDDDDLNPLARALAAGAASPGDLGGSSDNAASSSSHVSREAIQRWAKQRAGVAIADLLSALVQRLAPSSPPPPRLWPHPPPRLLLPSSSSPPPSPSLLLLSRRAALLLAPHISDPRRRERWRLVYSAALHGKSWSTLQGRLAAAGTAAAANVEARADAAALAAFEAARGGAAGGGGGASAAAGGIAGAGRGRAARAAAAAAAAATARDGGGDGNDDDEASGWSGPPATLVLARDSASSAVFGGFTSSAWRRRPDFYGGAGSSASSSSAFLFTLSPAVRVHPLSGINDRVQYWGSGYQSRPNGLGMGGQLGAFGLWLDASLETGHSRPNATYACASLNPASQEFAVADVEVWALLTAEEDDDGGGEGAGAAAKAGPPAGSSVLGASKAAERNFMAVAGRFADHSAGVRD